MAKKFRSDILPEDNNLSLGEIDQTCKNLCDLDLVDYGDMTSRELKSARRLVLGRD